MRRRPCQVVGCRFPFTHLTLAHMCGACGGRGHGQAECGDEQRLAHLQRAARVLLPQLHEALPWCGVAGCGTAVTHATDAHHCSTCGARGGGACSACPIDAPADEGEGGPPANATPACASAARIVLLTCPTCKQPASADVGSVLYTGGDCVVCFDAAPVVALRPCNHANVCAACAVRL